MKITRHFALAALALTVFGCASPRRDVRATVDQYFKHFYQGELPDGYALIRSDDRAAKDLDSFAAETAEDRMLGRLLGDKIKWTVDNVTVKGDRASVDAHVDVPTLGLLLKQAREAFAGGRTEITRVLAGVVERAKKGELKTTRLLRPFSLTKEDGQWRIDTNWAETKTAREAYMPSITVSSVKVERSGEKAVLRGEVRNAGEQSLSSISLVAYLLDAQGRPMDEFPFKAVAEPLWGFGGDKPLKPGYVREFGVQVPAAPAAWSGGVRVEPVDLTFE